MDVIPPPLQFLLMLLVARLREAERLLREARADVQFHSDEAECWGHRRRQYRYAQDCVSEQGACIDRLARIDAFLAALDTAHVHTDKCWEPDSGCDMGRNEEFIGTAEDKP
jgi:hypothetical protein